jgi:ferredoxin-NADP reductase
LLADFVKALGNIQSNPLASFAVADLVSGNVLYVTGEAKLLFGESARAIQPRSERIITIRVTGYLSMSNALTFGQVGLNTEDSPYSPPIRYLAEEPGHEQTLLESTLLKLNKIDVLAHDLATFTFDVSHPISVKPGQYAIIDCSPFTGRAAYAHMPMPGLETSINDDSIRTWTISSSSDTPTDRIQITMREKKGGAVTGRFFQVVRKAQELRPELLENASELGLEVKLVGVGGQFSHGEESEKFVMVAGGVGITPFLSMLSSMARKTSQKKDVTLIVSTREPTAFAKLVQDALGGSVPNHITLRFIVFSGSALIDKDTLVTSMEKGRLGMSYFKTLGDLSSSEVLICGPRDWEEIVLAGLSNVGVEIENVKREDFVY